jgi:hypothetical protein
MSRRALAAIGAAILIAAGAFWWWNAGSSDEREVRRLFKDFTSELNAGTTSGFGTLAHIARLAEFFSPDVVVELGQGSPPIQGRETLLGMVSRLQPRTSAFVLETDDVNVEFTDADHGEVTFTAVIRRRSLGSGEESIDAREFSGEVERMNGRWRVARIVAIDTLR